MAQYTNASKVVAISNSQLVNGDLTGSDWIDLVSSEIDTMLNTDFSLKDELYYVQLGESTSKILLKTPLYSTDVSNSTYTSVINSESLTYIYEDSSNKQLSPVVYIKEHDTKFPPLTDTDPLIEGKDYYVGKTGINRINGNFKQFLEIRFCWGYTKIPLDVQMLATLMTAEFALSSKNTTESMSERIGDYQYTSNKGSTTGSFSDNISNLKSSTISKYSLTSIASTTGILSNRGIIIDQKFPTITTEVSLPS